MNSMPEVGCLKNFLGQVREALDEHTTAKSQQYNFDFPRGQPLPGVGHYQWQVVDRALDRDGQDTAATLQSTQSEQGKLPSTGMWVAQQPCQSTYNTQP